jgi:diguanylate cyclase (GGDEF)-like protein
MGDLLQTCLSFDEAYSVVAHSARRLFPSSAGGLYIISASRNLVDAVATWGDFPPTERIFTPDQCWALRRGRVHTVEALDSALVCRHIDSPLPVSYLCVPMMAQGETLGSLHIRIDDENATAASGREQLAITMAEHISLALANLRLQQTLRDQAVHDLLTGLFNRRYMEEMLEREVLRATRRGTPVGIVMMDIDHFKQFNDLFGHDAGDALLSGLGGYLRAHVRGEDIACRYGGEEIALILPDSNLESTLARAEELRLGIASLRVENRRQPLGPVTVSMGVAAFPEHGTNRDSLLRAADRALYEAKAEGRDRVCMAASPAAIRKIGLAVTAN